MLTTINNYTVDIIKCIVVGKPVSSNGWMNGWMDGWMD